MARNQKLFVQPYEPFLLYWSTVFSCLWQPKFLVDDEERTMITMLVALQIVGSIWCHATLSSNMLLSLLPIGWQHCFGGDKKEGKDFVSLAKDFLLLTMS
jgi:hypothetical protein